MKKNKDKNEFAGRYYFHKESTFCPICSSLLLQIPYYYAEKVKTEVAGRNTYNDYSGQTTITTYKTYYRNVSPRSVGYCTVCARKDFERNQEELATKKPKPVFMIVCAAILALGFLCVNICSVLLDETPDFIGVIGILFLVDIPVFIVSLVTFLSKIKTYRKYRSGYRDELIPRNLSELSSIAARCMNEHAANNIEYMDMEKRKRLY